MSLVWIRVKLGVWKKHLQMCWKVSLGVLVTMNQLWTIATKTNDLGCAECYQQVKGGGPSLTSDETVQIQQGLYCEMEKSYFREDLHSKPSKMAGGQCLIL